MADPFCQPSFAPRLRYLCDYLTRHGWQLEVFTEQWDAIPFEHAYPITEVKVYHFRRGSMLYHLEWAIKAIVGLVLDWKNYVLYRKVHRLTHEARFDAVLCTTFSTTPLPAALWLAKAMRVPLYCDLRDIEEQVGGEQYHRHHAFFTRPFQQSYRAVNIRRRNRVLRQATALTTVSPWHVDYLKQYNSQTHLIYNGYNPDVHCFEPISTERFIISYIGRIYGELLQDPRILFEALREVQGEMPELELIFHTSDYGKERMTALAQAYGVESLLSFRAYVPTTEVPRLYKSSSICLVFSNQADGAGPKGMMTTKFFEIVGCEKPLLLVRSDEAWLAEAIEETNAGCAATSVSEAVDFIRAVYQQWKQQGYTHQAVNKSASSRFSREVESELFETILQQK